MLHGAQSQWHQLGTFLKVDVQSIDEGMQCSKLMIQMLKKWINTKGEAATVQAIIDALESPTISNNALAKRIKNDREVQTTFNYRPPGMPEGTMVYAEACRLLEQRYNFLLLLKILHYVIQMLTNQLE